MRITFTFYACALFSQLLLTCTLGFAQTPTPTIQPITLQAAQEMASRNVESRSAEQALLAAKGDIKAADHAPLPVFSTGVGSIDLQNGVGAGSWLGEKRVDKYLGLDWTWERGSKRELRTRAAKSNASAASQDLRDVVLQQRVSATVAFFDLLAAQQRLEQVTAIAASAKALTDAASKRLAAGDISAQDASRASIEHQRANNEQTLAKQDLQRAQYALSLVIDRDLQSAKNGVVVLQAKQDVASKPSSAQATDNKTTSTDFDALIDARADVIAAKARLDAAAAQLKGALALSKNDITVGTQIDHFPGTSNRLLMVRLQMPLQWGYSFVGEAERAQAQHKAAEIALERTRHAAQIDALRLGSELQAARARAENSVQAIAPAALKVAEQAELAYSKGAMSLTDLLEARRVWRATTLEAIAAQTDFEKAHAVFTLRTQDLQTKP